MSTPDQKRKWRDYANDTRYEMLEPLGHRNEPAYRMQLCMSHYTRLLSGNADYSKRWELRWKGVCDVNECDAPVSRKKGIKYAGN